jgi:hypothetical protein
MFRRYTGDTLRTHEVNLLYRYRDELRVVPGELLQLFRAIIVDTSDVIPGWFWFRKIKAEALRTSLLSLSTSDSSDGVRRRALELLRAGPVKVPKKLWHTLPLRDHNEWVRVAAYKYLVSIGDESVLPLLEESGSRDNAIAAAAARDAKLSILFRTQPAETASSLIKGDEYITEEQISKLKPILADLHDDILIRGIENPLEAVRRLCATELASRNHLTLELAEKLTEDPSVIIREIGFTELSKKVPNLDFQKVRDSLSSNLDRKNSWAAALSGMGHSPKGDAGAVICSFYRGKDADVVKQAVDWFMPDGVLAYKSLALDHYDFAGADLRSDLQNGFAKIKQWSIDKIRSRFGDDGVNEIEEKFKPLDDFIRSQFVECVLNALAVHGQPSDIQFGREYLTSDSISVKLAAVRIVCRFGTVDDSATLLQIANDAWGEVRDEAGLGALRLSPHPFAVAKDLVKNQSDKLVQAGFKWLYSQGSKEVENFFKALLNSESDVNRVRSVYYFSKHLRRKALAHLLEDQFEKTPCYYNVVTWLDRLLYAPRPLKRSFSGELERTANPA